ncbi:MAG: DEAD/DEAH box helicase, partial [Candidatus Thermoplasmatota archaeon]|nr:DEAD/DEAH box helicase [Candidatus Thermoplasmatota archaeon]
MSDWDLLHPNVSQIVGKKGWIPTPIQKKSIPAILGGNDVLLIAPTGSGKTESAALPLLSMAISEKWGESSIVYITPLRALNRDIDRRLPELFKPLNLKVALRHGDTPNSERQRQSRKPPHLWITTPETLQIMLLGSRLREHLSKIKAIIVDEVHDLAASERGSQLLLAIERIQALSPDKIQRIGLSATVGNPQEVAKWLSDDAQIVHGDAPRETKIRVHAPLPSPEDKILALDWKTSAESVASLRHITKLVEDESPALIFVNSRNSAETVALRMRNINP